MIPINTIDPNIHGHIDEEDLVFFCVFSCKPWKIGNFKFEKSCCWWMDFQNDCGFGWRSSLLVYLWLSLTFVLFWFTHFLCLSTLWDDLYAKAEGTGSQLIFRFIQKWMFSIAKKYRFPWAGNTRYFGEFCKTHQNFIGFLKLFCKIPINFEKSSEVRQDSHIIAKQTLLMWEKVDHFWLETSPIQRVYILSHRLMLTIRGEWTFFVKKFGFEEKMIQFKVDRNSTADTTAVAIVESIHIDDENFINSFWKSRILLSQPYHHSIHTTLYKV